MEMIIYCCFFLHWTLQCRSFTSFNCNSHCILLFYKTSMYHKNVWTKV